IPRRYHLLHAGFSRQRRPPPSPRVHLFCVLTRRPPGSPLFPYTTLFRSWRVPPPGRAPARSISAPITSSPETSRRRRTAGSRPRSEGHTSELQSRGHLVCRLLLEKKK